MVIALTILDLRSNNIFGEGVETLADALKVNAVLTLLVSGNNGIRDDGVTDVLHVNTAPRSRC